MDKRANILICGLMTAPLVVAAVEWDFGSLQDVDLPRMAASLALWALYVGLTFALATMRRPLPRFFIVWFTVAAPLVLREILRAAFHYRGMGWWWGLVSGGILAGAAILVAVLFDSLGWLGPDGRNATAGVPAQNRVSLNLHLFAKMQRAIQVCPFSRFRQSVKLAVNIALSQSLPHLKHSQASRFPLRKPVISKPGSRNYLNLRRKFATRANRLTGAHQAVPCPKTLIV